MEQTVGSQAVAGVFGRETELTRIRRLVRGVAQGAGGALVVRGAAGLGKTTLLAAALQAADGAGVRVLRSAGLPSESHLPFGGLRRLLAPLAPSVGSLPIRQRDALQTALGGADRGDPPDPFLIALAVLDLVADAAEDVPILLVVEDVHWTDRPTADALAFLGRRIAGEPVALLCAVREGPHDPLVASALPEVRLTPLDEAAALATIRQASPNLSEDLTRQVLAEADGNPLALVELAAAPSALRLPAGGRDLSDRLAESFAARLPDLRPVVRTCLLVLAADGSCTADEWRTATAIVHGAPLDDSGFLAAVDDAVEAGLIEYDGGARFRHPLVSAAVYRSAGATERTVVHRTLARLLAADPDRTTWHAALAAGSADPEVAARLVEAADRARRRGAVAVAVAALDRAAALSDDSRSRAVTTLRAAELATQLGRPSTVADLVGRVDRHELDGLEQGRLLLIREVLEPGAHAGPGRMGALVAAGTDARLAGHEDLALDLLWAAAGRCYVTDADAEDRRLVARATRATADPAGDVRALAILAYVAAEGHLADIGPLIARSTVDQDDPTAATLLGSAALAIGAYPIAAPLLDTATRELRRQGRLGQVSRLLCNAGWAAAFSGDLTLARTAGHEGARLATEVGAANWAAAARGISALVAAFQGDREHVEELSLAVQAVGPPSGTRFQYATTQIQRGIAALGLGDGPGAFGHLVRLFDAADVAHHYALSRTVVGLLAEAAVAAGEAETLRTRAVVDDLARLPFPTEAFASGLRFARAVLSDDRSAGDRFTDALSQSSADLPFDRGRLFLAHGRWLRRQRRTGESRDALRTARDTFDEIAAHSWSARARAELRASGESSVAPDRSVEELLSAQELLIAQMAAAGLSNREIGDELFLSHRTVGSHLYGSSRSWG